MPPLLLASHCMTPPTSASSTRRRLIAWYFCNNGTSQRDQKYWNWDTDKATALQSLRPRSASREAWSQSIRRTWTMVCIDLIVPTAKLRTDDAAGSPYTLGQAQSHLSQGPLGKRITWVQQSPFDYLSSLPGTDSSLNLDAAVLAHCL